MLKKFPFLVPTLLLSTLAAFSESTALPRSQPEAEGISSAGILSLVEALEAKAYGVHSLMIVRHGKVVAEGWWTPYAANETHVMFSLSKSFSSTAIGLAAAEGKLSINDHVVPFFPEEAPPAPSEHLKAMRIADLLKMSTGQHGDDIDKVDYFSDVPTAKQFFAMPVPHKPGTLFYYNTPASYLLSAIIQKATGQNLLDYLEPRLLKPLGIEGASWDRDRQGIPLGGFGLHLKTEDIAKFGQLYLQRGEWKGQRLLSEEWIDLATSRQASNGSAPDGDWDQGYGFQFWRSRHGYRGDGAFGQFCIILPEQDTVVAITSGTSDMGGVMQTLWDKLLPELRPAALPANEAAHAALKNKLASLTLPATQGDAKPASPAVVFGKEYTFADNPLGLQSVQLQNNNGQVTLMTRDQHGSSSLLIGNGTWAKGTSSSPYGPAPAAASGAWTAPDTFSSQIAFYRTPFIYNVTLRFTDGKLHVTQQPNVAFGGPKPLEAVSEPLPATL